MHFNNSIRSMLVFARIFVLLLSFAVNFSIEDSIGTLNFESLREDLQKRIETLNYTWIFTCETLSQYHWSIDHEEKETIKAEAHGEAPMLVLKCNSEFLFKFEFNVITIESNSLCANDLFDDDFVFEADNQLREFELYQAVENVALVGTTLYSLSNVMSVYEYYGQGLLRMFLLPSSDHFTSIAADWNKIVIGGQNSVYAYFYSTYEWSSVAVYPEPSKLSCSVAVSGSTLIVGRPDLNQVLIYDLNGSVKEGFSWSLTQTLSGPDESLFGFDVAIDGDLALVSVPTPFSGVRCYKRDGVEWRIFHTFSSNESSKLGPRFVALSGDIAAVAGDDEVSLYRLSDHTLLTTISGDVKDVVMSDDSVMVLNKLNKVSVRSVSMTISADMQPETK